MNKLPHNFNHSIYKYYNTDLQHLKDNELEEHFLNHGINESRIYSKLPEDFDFLSYKIYNRDLFKMTNVELEDHYLKFGIREGRIYKQPEYNNNSLNYENNINFIDKYKSSLTKNTKAVLNDKIKISIVMTYYNRKSQIISTLDRFNFLYSNKYDFEVIIVDDNSDKEHHLFDIINNYNFNIIYKYVSTSEKGNIKNSCIGYNKGFALASGDIIIIQNPECIHVTNILDNLNKLNLENNYYTLPVISSPSFEYNKIIINMIKNINYNNDDDNIDFIINYTENINEKSDSEYKNIKGWYNHEKYSSIEQRHMHFCSIISKNNLDKLDGFDENYAYGMWYDDNEFRDRIKRFLHIDFLYDNLVIHLFHENGSSSHTSDNYKILIEKNKKLYNELQNKKKYIISWNIYNENCHYRNNLN